jgi:predicted ATPase
LEVDTQGDSFFVAFSRASDALAAALDAQRAALMLEASSAEVRVPLRIGLHTGEALAREDGYIGVEVHRASRICNAGHGGQIVVSQITAELVRHALPVGCRLDDLGRHRLKDFDDPDRLFQLSALGLPAKFPRLRSLEVPTQLSSERTSFIGRQREIGLVQQALLEHSLVTLTGIGGSGKTRLALQVGALERDNFPDGVFFIDLATVAHPDLVAPTLATGCGLSSGDSPAGAARSLAHRLVIALAPRTCLLLVDNCEHLLDPVAELLDQLMAGCVNIRFLATSREALGVEGEQTVPVPSLAVPDERDPDAAIATESVRLFADRACAVQPAFRLDARSVLSVAEICRRLDGIPLAIEFAAARVGHLSVQQIAERLQDRFHLLTGGRRRIQRQQTLVATLDWSYDLLTAQEQIVLQRLAVFAGEAALEATEAVCSGADIPRAAVLDLLGSLAAKSMLTTVSTDVGGTRYRLLETVRIYAWEKLAAAGDANALRARHRDHYLEWLESIPLERLVFGTRAIAAVAREFDNLRTAADTCLSDDRPDLLARLITRMAGFWFTGHSDRLAKGMLERALAHAERLPAADHVACHAVLAWLGTMALDFESTCRHGARGIELTTEPVGPWAVLARCVRAFGYSTKASVRAADPALEAQARADVEEAIVMARSAGLPGTWGALADSCSPASKRIWATSMRPRAGTRPARGPATSPRSRRDGCSRPRSRE